MGTGTGMALGAAGTLLGCVLLGEALENYDGGDDGGGYGGDDGGRVGVEVPCRSMREVVKADTDTTLISTTST